MAAPSVLHEARRGVLGDVAALAGFLIDLQLGAGEYPDVARLHIQRPALLVGDAKATESPACEATRARLASYFRAIRDWLTAGFDVTVVICHSAAEPERWARLLLDAARDANCLTGSVASTQIDETTAVTWVDADREQVSTT